MPEEGQDMREVNDQQRKTNKKRRELLGKRWNPARTVKVLPSHLYEALRKKLIVALLELPRLLDLHGRKHGYHGDSFYLTLMLLKKSFQCLHLNRCRSNRLQYFKSKYTALHVSWLCSNPFLAKILNLELLHTRSIHLFHKASVYFFLSCWVPGEEHLRVLLH